MKISRALDGLLRGGHQTGVRYSFWIKKKKETTKNTKFEFGLSELVSEIEGNGALAFHISALNAE